MKISFYRHSLLSRGGDKMIAVHANHLVSLGYDVSITATVFNTVFRLDPRISLNKLPFTNKWRTILSVFKEKLDADLIIADIIPLACFLFPRYRGKVLYFAQDYDESYYSSPFFKVLIRTFYFVSLKIFRIPTISVSRSLADLLKKKFNAHVFVVENGVDAKVFYPDSAPELIAAKDGRKAVLLFSRSDRRKGFDIACSVIDRLREDHANRCEVWTVGENCAGVFDGFVHRDFGYVEEERLRQIMSSADLFLYPTRHEGFGLMPLEAFACCCPVVTTEAVSFAFHLENSLVAGVENIKQLADFVEQALTDPSLVEALIVQGVRVAQIMTLEQTERQFASAITTILTKG